MQPMVSGIDHESRNSLYNEPNHSEDIDETTPLITRLPQVVHYSQQDATTAITAGILLLLLISGITIGIYLLIEQSIEENVLPPVEMALQLVSRTQWDPKYKPDYNFTLLRVPRSHYVLATQTDTEECWTVHDCENLLQETLLNSNWAAAASHNFLVSSSGHTFEVLGWRHQPPLYSSGNETALFLGFIGNFTEKSPSDLQFVEAIRFFDESVSQQYLHPSFTILGKTTNYSGTNLFKRLQTLSHWDKMLSDV